ncbi:MAG: PaaI family thioesterase [Proteobacteria bacterium]|nr:MAG: PaaI family thioesterase [Pseudomonadota bacterium]
MKAADPSYHSKVRESFNQQKLMSLFNATLTDIEPGICEIRMPFSPHLTQQNGYLHAGAIASIADSAAGYAALSLAPIGASVLTTEYKINLLSPAIGETFRAAARVLKAGRTLNVVICDVFGIDGSDEKHCAFLVATIMTLQAKSIDTDG